MACICGIAQRLSTLVLHQILLRHVGNVFLSRHFRPRGGKRADPCVGGFPQGSLPPFIGIRKLWVYIKDNAAEGKILWRTNITDAKFCVSFFHGFGILPSNILGRHQTNIKTLKRRLSQNCCFPFAKSAGAVAKINAFITAQCPACDRSQPFF